jgi:hypothetical protein
MKAAKSPLTTILMAFSLALTSVESNAGESAKQPTGEEKNQLSPANQTIAGERTDRAASLTCATEIRHLTGLGLIIRAR